MAEPQLSSAPSNAVAKPATAQPPSSLSVFAASATRWGMDPVALEKMIAELILPSVKNPAARIDKNGMLLPQTKAQVAACLLVANELELNPFKKEIYFFEDPKQGAMRPIIGIDGWGTLANRHPTYDGEEIIYGADVIGDYCEGKLFLKGKPRPFVKRCYLKEWRRDTNNWRSAPMHMLWVRTRAHLIRFGLGFSVMDEDDFARMVEYETVRSVPMAGDKPRTAESLTASLAARNAAPAKASTEEPRKEELELDGDPGSGTAFDYTQRDARGGEPDPALDDVGANEPLTGEAQPAPIEKPVEKVDACGLDVTAAGPFESWADDIIPGGTQRPGSKNPLANMTWRSASRSKSSDVNGRLRMYVNAAMDGRDAEGKEPPMFALRCAIVLMLIESGLNE